MSSKNDFYKEFTRITNQLGRRYEVPRIFDDFLTMGICSLLQINISSRLQKSDPENEKLYLKTVAPYDKEKREAFGKLLGIVQLNVLEDPYGDLLGHYFTDHFSNGRNGQFFTPEPICSMMARIKGADKGLTGQRVLDPTGGSGRLLLQFAKVAPDNHFYANDVSYACAKMTALNFILNGMRGEVACMNSLSIEWFSGWRVNEPTLGILPLDKSLSKIWSAPPPKKQKPQQLTLF